MKIKYLKLKNWLYTALAGLLGLNFSGCTKYFESVEEYGCPSADFHVKGTVTDPDGNPIPGIQTGMNGAHRTTDTNGNYDLHVGGFPSMPYTAHVTFTDIDSTVGGSFKNDTIPVTFQRSDLVGGDGHWYEGTATKTLNVTLQREEE